MAINTQHNILFKISIYALIFMLWSPSHVKSDPAKPPSPCIRGTGSGYHLDWFGASNNTYFILSSEDMISWKYRPVIMSGADAPLSYGFDFTGDTSIFFCLEYTEILTGDPNADDFDGDGVSNWDEVRSGGLNTDPLKWDTDGDGNSDFYTDNNANSLPDIWENQWSDQFSVYPNTLSASLAFQGSETQTLYLSNPVNPDADFTVSLQNNQAPAQINYVAEDSISGGAVYVWNDISAPETLMATLSNGDDEYEEIVLSQMTFPFYGTSYDKFFLSTNGLITFGAGSISLDTASIPSAEAPNLYIAPFWDDLNPSDAGNIYYKEEADRLIIQFDGVALYGDAQYFTFQSVLHRDGRIEFFYKVMTGGLETAVIGLENIHGRDGLEIAYAEPYIQNLLAVSITPSPAYFVQVTPLAGSTTTGAITTLDVKFQSLGLPPGEYTARIDVSHTGTGTSPWSIPAVLNVVMMDTDLDGMDDDWERLHFGDLTELGSGDKDGDSLTNVQEYENNLDPNDNDDAIEDTDGDQIPNLYEILRNTDPHSSEDIPAPDYIVDPVNAANDLNDNIVGTINGAITAVASNGYAIIRVKPGIYDEYVVIPDDKKIALLGERGVHEVVISSQIESRCLRVNSALSVVDGFVVSGGGPYISLSLVRISTSGDPNPVKLINCIIRNGDAEYGGGLYLFDGNTLLDHVTITSNHASISGKAIHLIASQLLVRNSIIWGNNGSAAEQVALVGGSSFSHINLWNEDTTADPLISPWGYLTAASPARDTCAVLAERQFDIHGESRTGNPDAGADEFVDSDVDDLPDFWELQHGGMSMVSTDDIDETSGDSLSAIDEFRYGTSPEEKDTDGDGRSDGDEVVDGTAPNILIQGYQDSDGDRVPDLFEFGRGTDPNTFDDVINPQLVDMVPAVDATVTLDSNIIDPASGIYGTIQDAVDSVPTTTPTGNAYYSIIRVLAGEHVLSADYVYNGSNLGLYIAGGKRILFLADQSGNEVCIKPVSDVDDMVLSFSGNSCFDGFVFTPNSTNAPLMSLVWQNSWYNRGMLRFKNCIFRDFKMVDNYTAFEMSQGSIMLDHVTVKGIETYGTGAYAKVVGMHDVSSHLYLRNSIIWGNPSDAPVSVWRNYGNLNEVTLVNSWIEGGEFGASATDPFLDPKGYITINSPTIDAGVLLDEALRDIHGELRSNAPDVGADEYIDTDGDGILDWRELQIWGAGAITSLDADADGMSDSFELQMIDADAYDNISGLADVLMGHDFDGDLVDNLTEYQNGSDPADIYSGGGSLAWPSDAITGWYRTDQKGVKSDSRAALVWRNHLGPNFDALVVDMLKQPQLVENSFNGLPSLSFDNVDRLRIDSQGVDMLTPSSGFTVMGVFRPQSDGVGMLSNELSDQSGFRVELSGGQLAWHSQVGNGDLLSSNVSNSAIENGKPYQFTLSYGGPTGNADMFIDGNLENSQKNKTIYGNANGFLLNHVDGVTSPGIDWGELILLNRVLTKGERIMVQDYLMAKLLGSGPLTGDSDADGILDWREVELGGMTAIHSTDADMDSLPDAWEIQIMDSDSDDGIYDLASVLPSDDFDGDSISNTDEYSGGLNPANAQGRAGADVVWVDTYQAIASSSGQYVGSRLVRKVGSGSWNSGGRSSWPIDDDGDVSFSFIANDKKAACGLTAVSSGSGLSEIDYAMVGGDDGIASVYECGIQVSIIGAYTGQDVFQVLRVGNGIEYYQNDTLVYRSLVPSVRPLYVDASVFDQGAGLESCLLIGFSSTLDTDTDGLPDTWEQEVIDASDSDNIDGLQDISPEGDLDHDFRTNLMEYKMDTDALDVTSVDSVPVFWTANVKTVTSTLAGQMGSNLEKDIAEEGSLWDADAVSGDLLLADGWMTFRFNLRGDAVMCGLSTTNGSRAVTDLDFAIYGAPDGQFYVYELGVEKYSGGEYGPYDQFSIDREGSSILYKLNGTVFYTSLIQTSASLMVDTSFLVPGSLLENCAVSGFTDTADIDFDGMADVFEYRIIGLDDSDAYVWLDDVLSGDDYDGDGLSNIEEFNYQMNPIDKLDILTDKDGDRVSNWFEHMRGSDLTLAESKPTIDATVVADPLAVDETNGYYGSIQDAVDAVPATAGSDPYYGVIFVQAGSYNGQITVPSDKRITFLAEQGNGDVIINNRKMWGYIFDITSEMCLVDGFIITQSGGAEVSSPLFYHPAAQGNLNMLRLHNCIIRDCRDGIRISGDSNNAGTKPTVVVDHVTMTGISDSSVITLSYDTELHLRNSILWRNTSRNHSDQIRVNATGLSNIFVRDSWLEGGQFGGNPEDPQISPDGYLTHTSPVIDSCSALDARSLDFQGEALQGGVDAGADEFVDSDADDLPDFWELQHGGMTMVSTDDMDETSGDSLSAVDEFRYGTLPEEKDTDGDGRSDGDEVVDGTAPNILIQGYQDSDGDRVPDMFELNRDSNPLEESSAPAVDATVVSDPLSVDEVNGIYGSIQDAIDAVPTSTPENDPYYAIIRVEPGEYVEEISMLEQKILFLAEQGAKEVVIKPSQGTSNLIANESMTAVFDGFVFAPSDDGKELDSIVWQCSSFQQGIIRFHHCIFRNFELPEYAAFRVDYGSVVLDNVTVTGLNAHGEAKVVTLLDSRSDLYLRNSILWGNTGYASVSIYRENAETNDTLIVNSWIEGGEFGANDSDPLLIPEGYLMKNSPVVNAGTTLDASLKDIQGEPYVAGVDTGADEYLDTDGNGYPDWVDTEGQYYLQDGNGDGMIRWDAYEQYGKDDVLQDWDGDGIPNDYEIANGWDPLVANPGDDYDTYLASGLVPMSFTVFTELQ